MVLDVPGASEALSSALAHVPSDAQARTRVRSVVDAKGEQDLARWRAAFARAEGARDAARRALRDAVEAGDAAAARPLLDAADRRPRTARRSPPPCARCRPSEDPTCSWPTPAASRRARLDDASPASRTRASCRGRRASRIEAATCVGRPARRAGGLAERSWRASTRMRGPWRTWSRVAAVADLAAERSRPVRLAIVGEFNAGKSTFINALIGADVAPTGVLPTTATLHHLRWAPDAIARVFFVPVTSRPSASCRSETCAPRSRRSTPRPSRRVELLMPLPFLVRVEILDTPGFNAPDPQHAAVARARVRGGRRRALAARRDAGDEAERARGARRGAGARSCPSRCSSTRRTACAPRTWRA